MNPLKLHFTPVLLCIALCLVACVKEVPVAEQAAEQLVIDATLVVGSPITDIHAHGLRGIISDNDHQDLNILISDGIETMPLTPEADRPGYYNGPSDFIIASEKAYTLSTVYHDNEIFAETATPPAMTALSSSKDFIDAEIQGDLVFLEWSNVNFGSFNEYFYVIEISPLTEDQEEINRFSNENSRSTVVSYVAEATLSIDDFNFYGPHMIKVFALSKDYEEFFTAQSDPGLEGPSNIQGGYGYFIGASMVVGDLEIR